MTLVDVNLLIFAVHRTAPSHARAKAWLDRLVGSGRPVGFPWAVLVGFVRITTNPRIADHPYTLEEALQQVDTWLRQPNVRIIVPGPAHARRFADLCRAAGAVGNLVSDAHLAAMAVERGCDLASNDTDFGRFPGLRWVNPLAD